MRTPTPCIAKPRPTLAPQRSTPSLPCKVKNCIEQFEKVLDNPDCRFFGNVTIGNEGLQVGAPSHMTLCSWHCHQRMAPAFLCPFP